MSDSAAPAPATIPLLHRTVPHAALRLGVIGTLAFLLIGFVSIAWTPYPVDRIDVTAHLLDPSLAHPLGTDQLGRDLVSMLMKGTLTSFVVAAIGVGIGLAVGVQLGLCAATLGGATDWLVLRLGDFILAIPALATASVLAVHFGPDALNAMLAVGLFSIPASARITRRGMRILSRRDHVAAARLSGLSGWEAASRHILPALASLLVAMTTMQMGFAVLAEAVLSYAGIGAPPTGASLGLMLRDAQSYLLFEPILVLAPGLVLTLISLSLHLAGDGLRRLLEPCLGEEMRDHAAA